jgi:hypothetical protein
MTKATSVIKKVEVTNQKNPKPPQFNGKAGNMYRMWSMKFKGHGHEESVGSLPAYI